MRSHLRSSLIALALLSGATPVWAASQLEGAPRTAYINLFEWSWEDIAKECTNYLGPKGFAAVQVSPPQEHASGGEWWRRYQPVSFKIASRSGDREQFRRMVTACHDAKVYVYVDAVINHMASYDGGTGSSGSTWGWRNFPAVPFGNNDDFHQPKCDIQDGDYSFNRQNVTQCDMPGLPDLNTGKDHVQQKIADYLNDLRSLGVDGFRIDAAKHIRPSELAAIMAKVPGSYFLTQEVIRDATVGTPTKDDLQAYANIGTVNEFNYIYAMKNAFINREGQNPAGLNAVLSPGSSWNNLPSDKATVFVNNHDTERKKCVVNGREVENHERYGDGFTLCDSLNSWNREKFYLAYVFMLAHPYGYPQVQSGYNHNNHEQGPPQAQPYGGGTSLVNCSSNPADLGKWDCVHRVASVGNMVGFRNATAGTGVDDWQTEGGNRIAFRRGNKGFVALNNTDSVWQKTFNTGLPNGRYCNVVASDKPEQGICSGDAVIQVNNGQATLSVKPNAAVALHVRAQAGTPDPCTGFCPSQTPVDVDPAKSQLAAGQPLTLYYNGSLKNSGTVRLHWGVNGWTQTQQAAMTRQGDYWRVQITPPANATELDFVFTDGSAWDNNGGLDWKWPLLPCTDDCDTSTSVTLSFKVRAETRWGESVYITGTGPELGAWSTQADAGRRCSPSAYPTWTCTVQFQQRGQTIEYKYLKLGLGTIWESPPDNRKLIVPCESRSIDDGDFR